MHYVVSTFRLLVQLHQWISFIKLKEEFVRLDNVSYIFIHEFHFSNFRECCVIKLEEQIIRFAYVSTTLIALSVSSICQFLQYIFNWCSLLRLNFCTSTLNIWNWIWRNRMFKTIKSSFFTCKQNNFT